MATPNGIPTDTVFANISSPFHLSSSDNPSTVLVSDVFNGVGFSAWKRSMIISLAAKNKLAFVDGSILPPSLTDPTYPEWFRVNSMVISWILNSLHKHIAESVLFLQTAHDIWNELNQRYEQSDGALIYQIQQQLYSISQNSDEFSTYFTKLTKIWDELRTIQNLPPCSCGATAGIHKFLEEQRLVQLLMGLNDSYKVIRGQILMMKPLPSVSTAYSMIIQEERQRTINSSPILNTDVIAMNVSSNPSASSSKKSLVCTHCKKTGHSKSQCYRLIGFPPNFKFTKTRKDDFKSSVQNVTSSPLNITQEQYDNLIHLFNSHNTQSSSQSAPSLSQAHASISENSMNPEGPFIKE